MCALPGSGGGFLLLGGFNSDRLRWSGGQDDLISCKAGTGTWSGAEDEAFVFENVGFGALLLLCR